MRIRGRFERFETGAGGETVKPRDRFDPTKTQIIRKTAWAHSKIPVPCPHCGVVLNFHVTPDGKDSNPVPGDVTTCCACNSFLTFETDLSLRLLTAGERAMIFRSVPGGGVLANKGEYPCTCKRITTVPVHA